MFLRTSGQKGFIKLSAHADDAVSHGFQLYRPVIEHFSAFQL